MTGDSLQARFPAPIKGPKSSYLQAGHFGWINHVQVEVDIQWPAWQGSGVQGGNVGPVNERAIQLSSLGRVEITGTHQRDPVLSTVTPSS